MPFHRSPDLPAQRSLLQHSRALLPSSRRALAPHCRSRNAARLREREIGRKQIANLPWRRKARPLHRDCPSHRWPNHPRFARRPPEEPLSGDLVQGLPKRSRKARLCRQRTKAQAANPGTTGHATDGAGKPVRFAIVLALIPIPAWSRHSPPKWHESSRL